MTTSSTPTEPDAAPVGRSRLARMQLTLSVSPAMVRGNLDLLATDFVVERFRKVAPRVHGVNFTCHLDPFFQDAHGVFLTPEENGIHLRQMVAFQARTGITVTPVFNNIYVPNTRSVLLRFVESVKTLRDLGIRSISVPHLLWMKMGLLQRDFPEMQLKNTVLRRVRDAQDFWNHAEAGFDYINLDRLLVRDLVGLREIRAAQRKFAQMSGKSVVTSLLHAEGCLGACALLDEHYQHTLTHEGTRESPPAALEVFRYPPQLACQTVGDPTYNFLLAAGLPLYRADLEQVCELFDVVKLAGRGSFHSLGDCLQAAEVIGDESRDELSPGVPEVFRAMVGRPELQLWLERWRRTVRTCRFQCWRCDMCSEIMARVV